MITKISVLPDSKPASILFFKEADLSQFTSKAIPLFGPNGVGKSTLIRAVENKELGISIDRPPSFYSYQNSRDNFNVRKPRTYDESFDPAFLNARFDARFISEGQSIIYSMFDMLDLLIDDDPVESKKDIVLLLDEIDSGMSIDNIDTTTRKMKRLIKRRSNIQIIFSFNSPRVLKHFPDVLSMYDGTMIHMETDEDMMKVIRDHKRKFDRARKNSKGRPKIYD